MFYSCCDPSQWSTVVFFCVTWRGCMFSPLGRVGWIVTVSCHFLRVFFWSFVPLGLEVVSLCSNTSQEKSNVKIQRRIKLFNRICFGQSAAAAAAAATTGCGDQPPATCICEIVVLSLVCRVHRVLLRGVKQFVLFVFPEKPTRKMIKIKGWINKMSFPTSLCASRYVSVWNEINGKIEQN